MLLSNFESDACCVGQQTSKYNTSLVCAKNKQLIAFKIVSCEWTTWFSDHCRPEFCQECML